MVNPRYELLPPRRSDVRPDRTPAATRDGAAQPDEHHTSPTSWGLDGGTGDPATRRPSSSWPTPSAAGAGSSTARLPSLVFLVVFLVRRPAARARRVGGGRRGGAHRGAAPRAPPVAAAGALGLHRRRVLRLARHAHRQRRGLLPPRASSSTSPTASGSRSRASSATRCSGTASAQPPATSRAGGACPSSVAPTRSRPGSSSRCSPLRLLVQVPLYLAGAVGALGHRQARHGLAAVRAGRLPRLPRDHQGPRARPRCLRSRTRPHRLTSLRSRARSRGRSS